MKNSLISFACIIAALSGCSGLDHQPIEGGSNIYVIAQTAHPTDTKAPYSGTVPSVASPLGAVVCVSTDPNSFPADGPNGVGEGENGEIGKHLSVEFQSGTAQSLNDVYYNKDYVKDVYFTAVHPVSGWNFTDDKTASTTFDGSKDILFAPHTIGRYESSVPTLNFSHMLTYLKLEISAVGEDITQAEQISKAWGKIKTLTISSSSTMTIDLTDGATDFGEDKTEMNFYDIVTDRRFPEDAGFEIPTTPKMAAYVLCAPKMATDDSDFPYEYTLTLETENRSVILDIDLKRDMNTPFLGTTAGHQFTIGLNFKMGNNIAVSANINSWETGGIGTGNIEQ